jgi:arylsulfatase
VVGETASTLDLFPTFVAVSGATLPSRQYDGADISRLFAGEISRLPGRGVDGGRETLFWDQDGAAGLRSGRWKYLRPGIWGHVPALYDLEADPGETKDLSRDKPELMQQLSQRLADILDGY